MLQIGFNYIFRKCWRTNDGWTDKFWFWIPEGLWVSKGQRPSSKAKGCELLLFNCVFFSALPCVITGLLKKVIKIDLLPASGHVAVVQTASSGPLWRHNKQSSALWEHDSFTIQLLRDYGGSAYMSYCLHAEINCLQQIKSGTLETGAWVSSVLQVHCLRCLVWMTPSGWVGVSGCTSASQYCVYPI